MNNQSPLVPQGSLLDQKNKSRARVKIAVFFVLAVHGIGLMALLMQGCRQEKPAANEADASTNTPSVAATDTSTNLIETNAPTPVLVMTNPPAIPDQPTTAAVTAPTAETEYTVVHGDTLGGIARKNHVSLSALTVANAGVEPTKLKIGQKLHIPPAATPTTTAAGNTTAIADSSGDQVYTVKSGDVLYNIAHSHGTTVRALRAANKLKSDRIVVGQKLKIPVKAATPVAAPSVSPDSTTTAPVMTSASAAVPSH